MPLPFLSADLARIVAALEFASTDAEAALFAAILGTVEICPISKFDLRISPGAAWIEREGTEIAGTRFALESGFEPGADVADETAAVAIRAALEFLRAALPSPEPAPFASLPFDIDRDETPRNPWAVRIADGAPIARFPLKRDADRFAALAAREGSRFWEGATWETLAALSEEEETSVRGWCARVETMIRNESTRSYTLALPLAPWTAPLATKK